MSIGLWVIILLVSSRGVAQSCNTYVLVDPVDPKTSDDIRDLKAEDFDARLSNSPLFVIKATRVVNSRLVVLLEATNKGIESGISNVLKMALQAPAEQPIAFGVFAERAAFSNGFPANLEERKASVDELMAQLPSLGEKTALFDALHQALQVFGQHEPGDTILLAGTGFDDYSRRKGHDLERDLLQNGVRLLFASSPYRMIQESSRDPARAAIARASAMASGSTTAALKELTASTGGIDSDIFANGIPLGGLHSDGLYSGVRNPKIVQLGSAGYLLEIKLPGALDKPKSWELKLRGAEAKAHKDTVIFYPSKLLPCSTAAAMP